METEIKLKPSQQKPWLQFFSEEAKQAELPKESIYEHLFKINGEHRDDIAIRYFKNTVTYGKLLDDIDQCAAAFADLGVKKGDIVTFCSITIPELVVAVYALNKLGAAPMVLDPRNTCSSVGEFMENANSRILVTLTVTAPVQEMVEKLDCDYVITFSAADSMSSGLVKWIASRKMRCNITYNDRVMKWQTFMARGEGKTVDMVPYEEFQLAGIALTGGTTGAPKGVMFSNDGFNAVAMDFRYCGVSYTREQRFMNIIPSFASYGIVASLHMPLSLGLEEVVIAKFDSDKVGHLIKKYKPSHTLLVPNHYEKLMNSKEMANGFDLSFFETAGSGGDTMNKGLENKLNGFLKDHGAKFPLSQGYGMSEISSAASCCCNGNFRSLSVGYPLLTNVISIFKPDTTEELTYGEEGEICMTGPAVMMGYLNNPEETANVLRVHPDGQVWIHSGDVGVMDEDGYIFIKGRIKRMITMFDGHKVFPTQLENTIGKHQGVVSCAVVGVQDPSKNQGQMPVGIIKIKDGLDAEQVIQEVTETIQKEVEVRSWLSDLITVEDMPHTGMGKIDYKKLAEDYEKENQTAKAG